MIPTRLMRRPIVLHQRTATSGDYGTQRFTETTANVIGEIQQVRRDDDQTGHGTQIQEWNLYLPAGTVVDSDDEATVDGVRYAVVGEPRDCHNPRTGVFTHVEATLRQAG